MQIGGCPAFLCCGEGSGGARSPMVWGGSSWPLWPPHHSFIGAHSYCPFIPDGRAHSSQLPGSHAGSNLPFCYGVCLLQWLWRKQKSREPRRGVGELELPSQRLGSEWVGQSGCGLVGPAWGKARHWAHLGISSFWLSPGTFGMGKGRWHDYPLWHSCIQPFTHKYSMSTFSELDNRLEPLSTMKSKYRSAFWRSLGWMPKEGLCHLFPTVFLVLCCNSHP